MWIDAVKQGLRGVLFDEGTGRRIPFARGYDPVTGEYEAFVAVNDGQDILIGDDERPLIKRGKAVGRLKLLPKDGAEVLGYRPPAKVKRDIEPMTIDEKRTGLEQYKEVYVKVWNEIRNEPRRAVNDRWRTFLERNDFLDTFLLRTT